MKREALTLIELLVVVVIIGIVISLILPVVIVTWKEILKEQGEVIEQRVLTENIDPEPVDESTPVQVYRTEDSGGVSLGSTLLALLVLATIAGTSWYCLKDIIKTPNR